MTTKARPRHRELHALLFTISVWVLLRPLITITSKMQETGPTVYRPRRLQRLTICRYNYKGSTFSSVISRLWELVRSGARILDLSHGSPALYQLSKPGGIQSYYRVFDSDTVQRTRETQEEITRFSRVDKQKQATRRKLLHSYTITSFFTDLVQVW